MNTTMADGAAQRLVAQIGEALFGQPGLTLMELAEKVKASQPSPAGQGEALPRPLEDLRDAVRHVIDCADGGDEYSCGRPMIDALTTLGVMEKTGRGLWSVNSREAQAVSAALAARQPVDPERGHIDQSWSLHDRVEFALRDAGFDLDEAAFVANAADRARQPVDAAVKDSLAVGGGQPVAYWLAVDEHGIVEFGVSADDANEGQAARQEVNDFINGPLHDGGVPHRLVGVYAAPPAQAVDLGQFRKAVCAMGLYAEEPEDVDEAKRLLALIDGKAVGNG